VDRPRRRRFDGPIVATGRTGWSIASIRASAASRGRYDGPHATSQRRWRARIVPTTVVLRTLRHPFSRAPIAVAVVRDDANANRFRVIRAILIAIGSSTTRFREVVQKNFLCPSVDESDANPSS
jgi:hypothetical protein